MRGLKQKQATIDKYPLFFELFNQRLDLEEFEFRYELPKDMYIVAYHRRFVKKSEFIFS